MADSTTDDKHEPEQHTIPEPRTLDVSDTSPPDALNTEDGWDIEDGGRVRGMDMRTSLEGSAKGAVSDGDDDRGDDPALLNSGLPADRDRYRRDHSDVDDDGQPKGPDAGKDDRRQDDGRKPPRRSLAGRVERLRTEVGTLSGERRRTLAELEQARQELERVRRELAAGGVAPKANDGAADDADRREPARDASGKFTRKAATAEPPDPGPRPNWKQYDADGKTYDDFLEDQANWVEARANRDKWETQREIDEVRGQLKRGEQDAQIARTTAAFEARMEVVRSGFEKDEWDRVCDTWDTVPSPVPFLHDLVMLHPKGPHVYAQLGADADKLAVLASFDFTTAMFDAMMGLEDPSAVLLYLSEHPEEYEQIVQMPPQAKLIRIGTLDGMIRRTQSTGSRANGPRPVHVSQASTPIRPVGGTRTSTPSQDPSELEFGPEYVAQQNARDRERRF